MAEGGHVEPLRRGASWSYHAGVCRRLHARPPIRRLTEWDEILALCGSQITTGGRNPR
jgi:hypothetical protein